MLWRIDDQPISVLTVIAGKAAALKALIRSLPLLEPGGTLRWPCCLLGLIRDLIKTQGRDAFAQLLRETISWVDGLWKGTAERAIIWMSQINGRRFGRIFAVMSVRSATDTGVHR